MYIVYNETRQEKNFGIERNRKKSVLYIGYLFKYYVIDIHILCAEIAETFGFRHGLTQAKWPKKEINGEDLLKARFSSRRDGNRRNS